MKPRHASFALVLLAASTAVLIAEPAQQPQSEAYRGQQTAPTTKPHPLHRFPPSPAIVRPRRH